MNWQKYKRHYSDFRLGMPIIAPFLAISNFIILAYNFTDLKDMMPIEIFGFLFVVMFVITMVFMGKAFRHKQQSTDFDLTFERAKKVAMVNRLILEALSNFTIPSDPQHKEIQETIDYLRKIEQGTI